MREIRQSPSESIATLAASRRRSLPIRGGNLTYTGLARRPEDLPRNNKKSIFNQREILLAIQLEFGCTGSITQEKARHTLYRQN
jgi:hypothetical protein